MQTEPLSCRLSPDEQAQWIMRTLPATIGSQSTRAAQVFLSLEPLGVITVLHLPSGQD